MKTKLEEDKQEDQTTMFFAADFPPTSQEVDSHSQNAAKDDPDRPTSNDGSTIKILRRPRDRPTGSKYKPRPPVFISGGVDEPVMNPYILELPAGVDIVDSTARFSRKRNIGLSLLSGNGAVTNVTLKQPSATPAATVTFHGRFDILFISATILPSGSVAGGPFALSVAGPQGQVVGGHVVGPLISAGTIYLVAANFSNPSFHRLLPLDHDQQESGRDDSAKTTSGSGSAGAPPMSMYSYQSNDVVWPPATRLQPPPY